MTRLPLAAALLAAAMPAFAAGPNGKLPPYAESIRCAGLAEAAARRDADGIGPGRPYYDAALFWGMAASEAARKDGLSGARFTADQQEAAARARAELDAPGTEAFEELARCVARVPRTANGERG